MLPHGKLQQRLTFYIINKSRGWSISAHRARPLWDTEARTQKSSSQCAAPQVSSHMGDCVVVLFHCLSSAAIGLSHNFQLVLTQLVFTHPVWCALVYEQDWSNGGLRSRARPQVAYIRASRHAEHNGLWTLVVWHLQQHDGYLDIPQKNQQNNVAIIFITRDMWLTPRRPMHSSPVTFQSVEGKVETVMLFCFLI